MDDSIILLIMFIAIGWGFYLLGKIHGRLELMDEIDPDDGGEELVTYVAEFTPTTQATDLVDSHQPAKLRIVK